MTDDEAIKAAERYGLPIVRIPPTGCFDEVTTVNLLNPRRPVVAREPSSNFGPRRDLGEG